MDFISYTKKSEDAVLFRCFRSDITGSYIDLACHEAPECEITQSFYDRGWSGIIYLKSEALVQAYMHARPRDRIRSSADFNSFLMMAPGVTEAPIGFIRANASSLKDHDATIEQLCSLNASIILLIKELHASGKLNLNDTFERLGYRLAFEDELNAYYSIADKEILFSLIRQPLSTRTAKELNNRYREALVLLDQKGSEKEVKAHLDHKDDANCLNADSKRPFWKSVVANTKLVLKKILRASFKIPVSMIDNHPALKMQLVNFFASYPSLSIVLRKITGRPNAGTRSLTFVEPEVANEPDVVRRVYLGLCR